MRLKDAEYGSVSIPRGNKFFSHGQKQEQQKTSSFLDFSEEGHHSRRGTVFKQGKNKAWRSNSGMLSSRRDQTSKKKQKSMLGPWQIVRETVDCVGCRAHASTTSGRGGDVGIYDTENAYPSTNIGREGEEGNKAETSHVSTTIIGRKRDAGIYNVERAHFSTTIGRKSVVEMGDPDSDYASTTGRVRDVGIYNRASLGCYYEVCTDSTSSESQISCSFPSSPRSPFTPASCLSFKANYSDDEVSDHAGDSYLERLPFDLLVQIVCCLQHHNLKTVSQACRRLQKAVSIAWHSHFNFTTPEREGKGKVWLLDAAGYQCGHGVSETVFHLPTPKAPMHTSKKQARLEMPHSGAHCPELDSLSLNSKIAWSLPCQVLRSLATPRVLIF